MVYDTNTAIHVNQSTFPRFMTMLYKEVSRGKTLSFMRTDKVKSIKKSPKIDNYTTNPVIFSSSDKDEIFNYLDTVAVGR